MSSDLQNVSIFSVTSNIGQHIFQALLNSSVSGYNPSLTVFVSPSSSQASSFTNTVRILKSNPSDCQYLAKAQTGIDVVISTLNGPDFDVLTRILECLVDIFPMLM
ncbi:hypothetical protein NEOLEDRAFT_1246519 [Neolentinus lepideus HHB14362 ss-1]|uniref:NAD(P)-binding domain-containing protein n=1 Tax=Neolentinus lepideus HHB14362 ss-1 TaxID=1314782 RepID=A0A165MG05_9AGAM|nr:hypothetical protein NEOLEDRAFT_1246519 [Neolentinus lepideus HHB14362 ss-1]